MIPALDSCVGASAALVCLPFHRRPRVQVEAEEPDYDDDECDGEEEPDGEAEPDSEADPEEMDDFDSDADP